MSARLWLLPLCALLGACSATMKVTVRVADAEDVRYVATQQSMRIECLALVARTDAQLEAELMRSVVVLEAVMQEYQILLTRTAAALSPAQKTTLSAIAGALPVAREELAEEVTVQATLEASRAIRERLRSVPEGLVCNMGSPVVVAEVAAHRKLMHTFDAQLREMVRDVRRQMTSLSTRLAPAGGQDAAVSASAAQEAVGVENRAAAALETACRSLICDGGLASSSFAHALASLPESSWVAKFNKAMATGKNGNVDIVIKMTERADFTVKGMRFDVSKIPEMARKATTQGLLLAAQVAGVPIRTAPQAADQNVGLAPASVDLASTLSKQSQRDALLAQRRAALIRLGVLVASSQGEMDTDPGRQQLAAALNAQVTALDSLLRLTDYPQ